MKQYIYKITILTTNKSYIGLTNNVYRRISQHKHYAKRNIEGRNNLYKDWNRNGIDNYSLDILEEFEFLNKRDSYNKEAYYIKKYDTYNNGYNVCEYSSRHSEGSPMKGRKLSEEHRRHISENHWNRGGTWIGNPQHKIYIIKDNKENIYNCQGRDDICKQLNISWKQMRILISQHSWYTPRNHNKDKRSFILLNKYIVDKDYGIV